MSNLDSMASVREEARKKGGDELVKKIDHWAEREAAALRQLEDTLAGLMGEASEEDASEEDNVYAIVAMNEAISTMYGRVAVLYGQASKTEDAQVMVLAIRSLANSIQTAFGERDADKDGILAKIKGCTPKGGK